MDTPTPEQIAEACRKLDPRIEWRNPRKVPTSSIPVGFRLRTEAEYRTLQCNPLTPEQRGRYWYPVNECWDSAATGTRALTTRDTYLVPLSTHPLPLYEVEKLKSTVVESLGQKIAEACRTLDPFPEKPQSPPTGTDRRRTALKEVEGCVCRDRQNMYSDAEDNFSQTASIWTVQLSRKLLPGVSLDASDVAALMVGLKLARTAANPSHRDNWIDAAGYAVCGAGIQQKAAEDAAAKATYATHDGTQSSETRRPAAEDAAAKATYATGN